MPSTIAFHCSNTNSCDQRPISPSDDPDGPDSPDEPIARRQGCRWQQIVKQQNEQVRDSCKLNNHDDHESKQKSDQKAIEIIA